MNTSTDLTHTLRQEPTDTRGMGADYVVHDEVKPMTLKELQDGRMVATNDARGVPYSFGTRAARRMVGRNGGTGGKPKQYHKQGH